MLVSREHYAHVRDGYELLRRGLALILEGQEEAPQGSLERELLGESADRAVLAIEYAELAMRDMTVEEPRPEGDAAQPPVVFYDPVGRGGRRAAIQTPDGGILYGVGDTNAEALRALRDLLTERGYPANHLTGEPNESS